MRTLLLIIIIAFISIKACDSKDSSISNDYENNSSPNATYETVAPSTQTYYGGTSNEIYHTDQNYKYEYRTGSSSPYEYNYDINGTDENGNSVYGNIDIEGKYGSGTIEDEDGNEIDVDVEWVDHGVLEATDGDGNTYDLEVD